MAHVSSKYGLAARNGFSPKRLLTAAVLASSVAAGGCGQGSLTPLPELTKFPSELINAEQKKAAMKEMAELRAKHESRAIEVIEKAR